MTSKDSKDNIGPSVDVAKELYSEGGDFQLLCCMGVGNATTAGTNWVSAAEIIYDLTENAGSVVRNRITFETDKNETIVVNLLDGSFEINNLKTNENIQKFGRKGLDLLMKWKDMTLGEALHHIIENYSIDQARLMGQDYLEMLIDSDERLKGPPRL